HRRRAPPASAAPRSSPRRSRRRPSPCSGDSREIVRQESPLTHRGRAVLALGFGVYLAAWIFGSRALYPVATGLILAVALAVGWVRFSTRPPQVRRHGAARDVVEGDDVRVDLELTTTGAIAPPTLVAHERPGRLEERRIELRRVGPHRFAGGYELRAVP